MKIYPDRSGKYPVKIYYDLTELDYECEDVVTKFLNIRHKNVAFPLLTDDLTVLIEQKTSDFDQRADLSADGQNIEGVTIFQPTKKPEIRISEDLWAPNRENRLRSTMAHELGHAHFHRVLFENILDTQINQTTFLTIQNELIIRCKRESIISSTEYDWVEWQASYASGSFLMPITYIKRIVHDYYQSHNILSLVNISSKEGVELIQAVRSAFQVSEDAAKVRLLKLNSINTEANLTPSLL